MRSDIARQVVHSTFKIAEERDKEKIDIEGAYNRFIKNN